MSVHKDDSTNTWRVVYRYTDYTGKNKQSQKRGFATKREALAWERENANKLETKLDMTFASFVEIYTEDMKKRVKENTWKTKEHIIETKILPHFKKRKIGEILPKDILAWQNKMLSSEDKNGKPFSPSYLKTIHNQLSAIFNHACKFYGLTSNPAAKVGNMGKATSKEMEIWTQDEYRKFAEQTMDKQITETFSHTRLNPARATSGRHLVNLVNSSKADVITSIINKFNTVERLETKNFSRDIFILVDESHRSNYGLMATKMRSVFPNACYIGFTGTPLMKKEKNTMTKFGKLIHKYTIKDGVDDGAIVPLIYEGRFVEQTVDEQNIDLWFKQTTKRLTDAQKEDLRKKWSSIRRLTSTDARIKRIALDINTHFLEGFKGTKFKAMLATNYKRDAIRYLECFEQFGDLTCGVVISPPDMREGVHDADEGPDDKVVAYWEKMMRQYGDADTYEEAMKSRFKAGEIDILIVCSKLLTGFDAPICQVLYIDKELKEHGLLQAIARTNRLCEGKDYGLIVDYRGLIEKLDTAMDMYSGAGLENYDSGDLKGVVVDVMSEKY